MTDWMNERCPRRRASSSSSSSQRMCCGPSVFAASSLGRGTSGASVRRWIQPIGENRTIDDAGDSGELKLDFFASSLRLFYHVHSKNAFILFLYICIKWDTLVGMLCTVRLGKQKKTVATPGALRWNLHSNHATVVKNMTSRLELLTRQFTIFFFTTVYVKWHLWKLLQI